MDFSINEIIQEALNLASDVSFYFCLFKFFSMNTSVTATNMQIKAAAEDGLLIHNELDADTAAYWLISRPATYGTLVALTPTSSADMTHWYHNKSNDPNNYAGVESYEEL